MTQLCKLLNLILKLLCWSCEPCAKVWASGFASALLPRRSATSEFRQNVYAWMECFFEQWLQGSPGVRLQQLAGVLQKYQTFPQLYIYSESDHVVPHTSVEAFMEVICKSLDCNDCAACKIVCSKHCQLYIYALLCVSRGFGSDNTSLQVLMCSCDTLPYTRWKVA